MGSLRSLAHEKRKISRLACIEIHVRDYTPACYDWRSVSLNDLEEARRAVNSLENHDIEVSYYKSLSKTPDVYDDIPYFIWGDRGWVCRGKAIKSIREEERKN